MRLYPGGTLAETTTVCAASTHPGSGDRAALVQQAKEQAVILVVDDLDINRFLVARTLQQEQVRFLEAASGAEAIGILENEPVDLVILDQMMPGMDGLECCRRIKAARHTELVPVLMVSSMNAVELEIAGIGAGADEYLHRPFHPDLLRARVRALLRHKMALDRLEESEGLLVMLAQSVEQRDNCTGQHCERLASLSVNLGASLGLSRQDLLSLQRGGYLHDVGKIAVPDAILCKPGALDEAEWEVMRSHTVIGEQMCKTMKCLRPVLPIIRSHHERWDGSGYPDGLRRHEIPLLARILQLSDIIDALTSARPYKRAFTTAEALEIMRSETARGWRDPELMDAFAAMLDISVAESLDHMSRFLSAS